MGIDTGNSERNTCDMLVLNGCDPNLSILWLKIGKVNMENLQDHELSFLASKPVLMVDLLRSKKNNPSSQPGIESGTIENLVCCSTNWLFGRRISQPL